MVEMAFATATAISVTPDVKLRGCSRYKSRNSKEARSA